MALEKEIILPNGVPLRYHRITNIQKVTNVATIIEISSYVSKEKRDEESEAIKNGTEMNVYIDTTLYSIPYNENSTIKDLYAYVKSTDKFKDAKDV